MKFWHMVCVFMLILIGVLLALAFIMFAETIPWDAKTGWEGVMNEP